jgi:hypothetical protein
MLIEDEPELLLQHQLQQQEQRQQQHAQSDFIAEQGVQEQRADCSIFERAVPISPSLPSHGAAESALFPAAAEYALFPRESDSRCFFVSFTLRNVAW